MIFSDNPAGGAALIMQLGGVLSSSIGGFYSSRSQIGNLNTQATNARTQAVFADINARISELGAQSALEQGKQQKAALTLGAKQLKGRQRASMAANGVDLSVGNAAEIQASTELMKDIDVSTLKSNVLRTAWGYRAQGLNQQNQAAMLRISADMNDATAGAVSPTSNAVSSLLGGASNVASSWYAMNQAQNGPAGQYDSIDALAADKGWW